MKAVLGGALEAGIIRQLTCEFDPERLETTHSYYRGLQRAPDANAFSRAATVLAIADSVLFPQADWSSTMLGDQAPPIESLGWQPYQGAEMWKEEWVSFIQSALDASAFSSISLNRIRDVPSVADQEDGVKDFNDFSVHYLMRLLLQVDAAGNESALLFLPANDEVILSELSAFAKSSSHLPPLPLPEMENNLRASEAKSLTLLAFQPPDCLSLVPVREDKSVRKYAEKVVELWELPDPIERERKALNAMRDVLKSDEVRGWTANVFEASSWALKGMGWLGVPFVGAVGDARDFADAAREQERRSRNWLLIRTSMNDISLQDYLRRTGNL